MDKTLKIVFSSLTLFLLIGFQNLYSKGKFIVPYELNTTILLLVSILVLVFGLKLVSLKNNLIYSVGILSYSVGDQRFLEIINYKTDLNFIKYAIGSPFTYLIAIVIFYSLLVFIFYKAYDFKNKLQLILFLMLIIAFVSALSNLTLLTIVFFNLFVFINLFALHWWFTEKLYDKISPVSYQLFLFIVFENIYLFIA